MNLSAFSVFEGSINEIKETISKKGQFLHPSAIWAGKEITPWTKKCRHILNCELELYTENIYIKG